ncbi:MAG: hypothetical protein IJ424_08190 [Oscillospiraceae bacterium]|nr:hypothetical protein [Oscillospiraceae bacterium]
MTERLLTVKSALLTNALKHAKMRPQDAVKLVYQACFGPGHLISDPQKAFEYLKAEYEATRPRETAPLCEPIGLGMARVNLAALDPNGVEIEKLFAAFIASSKIKNSDMAEFLKALELLKSLCKDGVFRFGVDELNAYLEDYAKAGYPMVSHSKEYKQAYEPAYRVVLEEIFRANI